MKKIVVTFNSSSKIQKLKKIMKKVYSEDNNNIPEIAKFNLNKDIIPAQVEKIEIEIKKIIGSNLTVTIPQTSLTFLTTQHPYDYIDNASDVKSNYILLPWNIKTAAGKQELKNLISKISTTSTGLKYTVFVNEVASWHDDNTASVGDFNLSDVSVDDNVEELLNRIQELENNLNQANSEITRQQGVVVQRDSQIHNLNNQARTLNNQLTQKQNQINSLNTQVSSLQNTNYSQSSQLTQYTSNRNSVVTEYSTAPRYIYRLTNYTGRVTVGAGTRIVGGTITSSMGHVTATADVKFD